MVTPSAHLVVAPPMSAISFKKRRINIPSLEAWSAMYSASVVDVETVRCFLLDQESRAPSMKKQYPMTDLWSSGSSAKFLSEYHTSLNGGGDPGPSSVLLPIAL